MSDMINHPDHYINDKVECIDAMIETQGRDVVMDHCVCCAFKYLWRHNRKGGPADIYKAHWYLSKYIELDEEIEKELLD